MMDELSGDRASWQYDGRAIHIRYHAGRSADRVLSTLGQCQVPVLAISAVDFRAGEKRQGWTIRLRLRDRTDPYAAAGVALAESSDPFRLAGPAKTRLVAEYWTGELAAAAQHAAGEAAGAGSALGAGGAAGGGEAGPLVPPGLALGFVPPVPLHIRTAEGTAAFDGTAVRLVWSGSSASRRKRREQRREFALSGLVGVDWVPSDGWQWGHVRLLTRDTAGESAVPPKDDLSCLRCNEGEEGADALLFAVTVTAHIWSNGAVRAPERSLDRDSQVIYERIRELGRLHADGILTDAEFATKKAELLDRL